MPSLIDKIRITSTKWFGKSDLYTNMYLLYILCGVLPLDMNRFQERRALVVFLRIVQSAQLLACAYCYVAFVVDTYQLRHDVEKFTLSLCFSTFFVVATSRIFVSIIKNKTLQKTVKTLDNFLYLDDIGKSEEDLEILNNGIKQFKKIIKFFSGVCLCGNFFRIVCKMIDQVTLIPIPFVENDDRSMYTIMFIWDVVGLFYLFSLYLFHEMTVAGIFIRIEQHYLILEKNISEMGNVFSGNEEGLWMDCRKIGTRIQFFANKLQQKKLLLLLKRNVFHHQKILQIVHQVNNLYRVSFLINIFGGGTLLVILYFHLSLHTKSYTMTFVICQIIYSLGVVVDITVVCYYGSRFRFLSLAAARALYFDPWLQMDMRNRRMLRFFHMALSKEPSIKAGLTFSLDLTFFVSFLQSIYTYLAFMQKALNREQ